MKLLLIITAILLLSGEAWAGTVWVNRGCTSDCDGTTKAKGYATVPSAVGAAGTSIGDTIMRQVMLPDDIVGSPFPSTQKHTVGELTFGGDTVTFDGQPAIFGYDK